MAFTGNENHDISLDDAIRFTARYREISGGGFQGGYFGKSALMRILNQTGCAGIRIYNAVDDENKNSYVLVGVAGDEKDMHDGELAEFSIGCPPFCPFGSPLAGTD